MEATSKDWSEGKSVVTGGFGCLDRFLDWLSGSDRLVDYLLLCLFVNCSHAGQSGAKRQKVCWRLSVDPVYAASLYCARP